MSNAGFGQGPKKETVYGGPTPTATQGTIYGGFSPAGAQGTVYGTSVKTAEGTVYGGPVLGGTVYNGPATGAMSRPASSAAARSATAGSSNAARKAAQMFYLIAGLSVIRTILVYAGLQALTAGTPAASGSVVMTLLLFNLLFSGIFAVVGFFTQQGSKIAFVTGMVLYALDLALLVMNNPALHAVAIGLHALILFYFVNAFRQLPE